MMYIELLAKFQKIPTIIAGRNEGRSVQNAKVKIEYETEEQEIGSICELKNLRRLDTFSVCHSIE